MKIDNNKGFTLIEICIAMLILVVGMLALSKLQLISINGNASAKFATEANRIAYSEMEKIAMMPFTDPNDPTQTQINDVFDELGIYYHPDYITNSFYSVEIECLNLNQIEPGTLHPTDNVEITISVKWSEGAQQREIILGYRKINIERRSSNMS